MLNNHKLLKAAQSLNNRHRNDNVFFFRYIRMPHQQEKKTGWKRQTRATFKAIVDGLELTQRLANTISILHFSVTTRDMILIGTKRKLHALWIFRTQCTVRLLCCVFPMTSQERISDRPDDQQTEAFMLNKNKRQ